MRLSDTVGRKGAGARKRENTSRADSSVEPERGGHGVAMQGQRPGPPSGYEKRFGLREGW